MKKLFITIFAALLSLAPLAQADKLLTQDENGLKEGLASQIIQNEAGVTLNFAADQDFELISTQVKNKLTALTVEVKDNSLLISGAANADIIKQLASLDIELDPLLALGGLGAEQLAMNGPEAGGSIRASKTMDISPEYLALPSEFKKHAARERFTAKIVAIERGDFPEVYLTLRVRQVMSRDSNVKDNQSYRAVVLLPAKNNQLNLDLKKAQENLAAYYLVEGDKIEAHVARQDSSTIYLDYIKRVP